MEGKKLLSFALVSLAIIGGDAERYYPTTTTTESSLIKDIWSFGVQLTDTVSDKIKEIPLIFVNDNDNITFNLFTRNNINESYKLKVGDLENLQNSYLNVTQQTKIIIHRFNDNQTEKLFDDIRYNYLTSYENNNVIKINWKLGESSVDYSSIINDIKLAGLGVGQFLEFLSLNKYIDLKKLHILGHGIDAHVAGYAGSYISSKRIGKVGRITGLDPAGVQNERDIDNINVRLGSSDAKFVDIIHTCIEVYGLKSAVGHADIYPNGGFCKQPGCSSVDGIQDICGHKRAIEIMSESIKQPSSFIATKCNNWNDYKTKKCDNNFKILMGEYIVPGTRGIFYLDTNNVYPFGKGVESVYNLL